MFVDFLKEYMIFIIMIFSTIIIMTIVYFLITKSNSYEEEIYEEEGSNENKDEPKEEVINDESPKMSPENIPTIITSFAKNHEEREYEDEISSNLYKIKNPDVLEDNQSNKELGNFQDETLNSYTIRKNNDLAEKEFSFLYEKDEDLDIEKNPNKRYHVLYQKENNKWFVKREGNKKKLKLFETQKEAIAYATIKSLENETSVVVHRRDGVIRKYSL